LTRNLIASPEAVLHVGGLDVPVMAQHVDDPNEARAVTQLVRNKYGAVVRGSAEGELLRPGEQATFELLPAAD
jgi:hypothetical protein